MKLAPNIPLPLPLLIHPHRPTGAVQKSHKLSAQASRTGRVARTYRTGPRYACWRVYNHFMKVLLFYAGFLIFWFFVAPRIPGISRFT
jgi:hypothetical protein